MEASIDALMPEILARPAWGINHVLAYGQSLSCGWDGWPTLSSTPRHDSLMLGQSVHPRDHASPNWQPVGAARFQPLIATMQAVGKEQPFERGQLQPGDVAVGETILETALNEWRGRALSAGHATIGQNRLLASSCGVGGRSIEDLSDNADPNLFHRLRLCMEAARNAAHAIGQSYGVAAVLFLQGEANNLTLNGASDDTARYAEMFRQLSRDLRDTASSITGQTSLPVIFTYQTGGAYATAANPIPQAQLNAALEAHTIVLVSPVYYLPHTPSGLLDANGYRWLGAQFGKVMHRVLHQGKVFRPTHPVHNWCDGTRITIAFYVPEPPLAWGSPIPGDPSGEIANRGFVVRDAAGEIPIVSVDIGGPKTVHINLARPPGEQAVVSYATAATGGRGCLHDSDSDQSMMRYTIVPHQADGFQTPAPELEGRPYALRNWCAAFTCEIATSENNLNPTI